MIALSLLQRSAGAAGVSRRFMQMAAAATPKAAKAPASGTVKLEIYRYNDEAGKVSGPPATRKKKEKKRKNLADIFFFFFSLVLSAAVGADV